MVDEHNETVPDFEDDVPTDPEAEPEDAEVAHEHPDPDALLEWGDEERQG